MPTQTSTRYLPGIKKVKFSNPSTPLSPSSRRGYQPVPLNPQSPHSPHSPRHHQQKHNHHTRTLWPRTIPNNSPTFPSSSSSFKSYLSPSLITILTSITCVLTFLFFTFSFFASAPPGEGGVYSGGHGLIQHDSKATDYGYDAHGTGDGGTKSAESLTKIFSIGLANDYDSMMPQTADIDRKMISIPITVPLMSKLKHEILRDVVCHLRGAGIGDAGNLAGVTLMEEGELVGKEEEGKKEEDGGEAENDNGVPNECTWLVRKEEWFHGHRYEHVKNSTLTMGDVGSDGTDGNVNDGYKPWECDLILGNRMYIPRGVLPIRLPVPSLSSSASTTTKFTIDFSNVPCGLSTSTSTSSSMEKIFQAVLPAPDGPLFSSNKCTTAFRLGKFRLKLEALQNINSNLSQQHNGSDRKSPPISHLTRDPTTITIVNIALTGTSLDSDSILPENPFQFQVPSPSSSSLPNIQPEYIDIDLTPLNLNLVRKLDFNIATSHSRISQSISLKQYEQQAPEVDYRLQLSFGAVDTGELTGKTRGEIGLEVFLCKVVV